MDQKFLERYADLLLGMGVALDEGRALSIACEPVHWDFVNILIKKAYQAGAKYVKVDLQHALAGIYRANYSKEEYLSYVPPYFAAEIETFLDERWSLIRLDGKEDPDIYKMIDQERNGIITKATREVAKPLRNAVGSSKVSWTVAAVPTKAWAAKVMNMEPSDEAVEAFWEVLIPILRLDHEDPVQAWREHSDKLRRRSTFLTESQFDYFHFTGPDTDLKVYMNPRSQWEGGSSISEDGRVFFPNLPTEEVYTTPNFRKTEGRVKVTRPVSVLGDQVEGAWFEFKEGKVVDFGADYGKHIIEQYFEIDPNARYLGEVALVDENSPIARSGKIFHSILFDENASCHIALGSGYPSAIKDGDNLSEEEQREVGCNVSLLHTDFMIGSKDVDVTAYTHDGTAVPIIEKGSFVID